jgi:hypothetical protein
MYNITLICTEHEENGMCNLDELYKIIEKINPEIIFEEIPPSFFDSFYKYKDKYNLETNTINKYLESHQIEHIPVDYYNIPNSFHADNRYMFKQIAAFSFEYRNLMDTHSSNVNRYGFKYLNSIDCNEFQNELYNAIEKALQKINTDKLFQTYKLWNDVMKKREYEMINNIYSYSKEHRFNRGLFFIGAAHRETIINKIQKHAGTEYVKLNWNYSNYDNIL